MNKLNLVSGNVNDFSSVYAVAGGNTTWTMSVGDKQSFNIEIISGAFTYDSVVSGVNLAGVLDGTVTLEEGSDGTNFQTFAGSTALVLNSATKKGGWKKENCTPGYLRLSFVKNNLTAGTVRVMITIKNR